MMQPREPEAGRQSTLAGRSYCSQRLRSHETEGKRAQFVSTLSLCLHRRVIQSLRSFSKDDDDLRAAPKRTPLSARCRPTTNALPTSTTSQGPTLAGSAMDEGGQRLERLQRCRILLSSPPACPPSRAQKGLSSQGYGMHAKPFSPDFCSEILCLPFPRWPPPPPSSRLNGPPAGSLAQLASGSSGIFRLRVQEIPPSRSFGRLRTTSTMTARTT